MRRNLMAIIGEQIEIIKNYDLSDPVTQDALVNASKELIKVVEGEEFVTAQERHV
jgi:hypothetical protein